jgi:hypothetical protein
VNAATPFETIESQVISDLQKQPTIMLRLAENALNVAGDLRGNYFQNTAKFVSYLRSEKSSVDVEGKRLLGTLNVSQTTWEDCRDELVTFIDGGVGTVQIASRVPILLRVGSYHVKTGERDIKEREKFGYYPVILGDLEGGSRERKDFTDIVRITAELLGALAALEREPNLRVLMLHGPLVNQMGQYAGHTPFTEADIDLFLNHYAESEAAGKQIKEDFFNEAKLDVYPRMTAESDSWVKKRLFEPLAWLSFLHRRLIQTAKQRNPVPLILGVVERGELRSFSMDELLPRLFRRMRQENRPDRLNELFGRTDLVNEEAFLNALGYTDGLLLAMLLRPGEVSEPWEIKKYETLRNSVNGINLPGEAERRPVNFSALDPSGGGKGFPVVNGCYLQVLENAEPLRIETYAELGKPMMREAAQRVHLYSRLLPGYGFPVGLDVADKFAKVPVWLTSAYEKLIKFHLGVGLQTGDIKDEDMRRILVQAIYMTHRDWLFRPQA